MLHPPHMKHATSMQHAIFVASMLRPCCFDVAWMRRVGLSPTDPSSSSSLKRNHTLVLDTTVGMPSTNLVCWIHVGTLHSTLHLTQSSMRPWVQHAGMGAACGHGCSMRAWVQHASSQVFSEARRPLRWSCYILVFSPAAFRSSPVTSRSLRRHF